MRKALYAVDAVLGLVIGLMVTVFPYLFSSAGEALRFFFAPIGSLMPDGFFFQYTIPFFTLSLLLYLAVFFLVPVFRKEAGKGKSFSLFSLLFFGAGFGGALLIWLVLINMAFSNWQLG